MKTTDMREVLAEVFAMFDDSSVRNWLVDITPVEELSVLSSPALMSSAIAATVTVSHDEVFDKEAIGLNGWFVKNLAIVPVLNIGSVTLGLLIEELHDTNNSRTCPGVREQVMRLVRDSAKGIILSIVEHPRTHTTVVQYLRCVSPVRNLRLFMHFDHDLFREAVDGPKDQLLGKLLPALRLSGIVEQNRFKCATCSAPQEANCCCVLKYYEPQHPHDFQYEAWNSLSHIGDFAGEARLLIFRKDRRMPMVAKLMTQTRIEGGCESTMIPRMRQWSIQNRASCLNVSALNMAMPMQLIGLIGDANAGGMPVHGSSSGGICSVPEQDPSPLTKPITILPRDVTTPERSEDQPVPLTSTEYAPQPPNREIDEERRRKAEIRKAKQREAAAISNKKRQQALNKLRLDSKESKQLVENRRARVRLLLEENQHLKLLIKRKEDMRRRGESRH